MSAKEALEKFGLTVTSEFVPWSKSRNAGEKGPSLNWKVTLLHNGKKVLTTDYMAGMGHAPAYKEDKSAWQRMTVNTWDAIKYECETGKQAGKFVHSLGTFTKSSRDIVPDACDVIYSLLMDAEALDYSSFEDWADCFGYDTDSRQAESIYKACLKIALPLRNTLGDTVLAELREAFQDY